MSYLLETYSKIKIEYILKITFKDGLFKLLHGKTPYFDFKKYVQNKLNLNNYFEINHSFFLTILEDKITDISLKAILLNGNKFKAVNVFEDFHYDKNEIDLDLNSLEKKVFLSNKTINNKFSELFLKEMKENNISNESFLRIHEVRQKEFYGYYDAFIKSQEEYSNIYPSKLNMIETINFLKNKDIYDAVDFFSDEYFDELYRGYEESKMLYTEKGSNLKEQIELLQDLHRSTDAYKKWKVMQFQKKINNSNYNNRDVNYFCNNDYRENYCPYCMESPCQCSDNQDFQ